MVSATPIYFSFFSPLMQLYISEMSHERVRGTLGSCVQLMVVLGIMGVYLAGMYAQLQTFFPGLRAGLLPCLLSCCRNMLKNI